MSETDTGGKNIYHILVVDKAKILPCNKTLSFD